MAMMDLRKCFKILIHMPVHVLCQLEVQPCNLSHHLHLPFFTGSLGKSTVAILVEDTVLVAFLICNELVLSNLCFLLFLQIGFVLSLIVLRPLGQGFYNLPFPIFTPVLCLEC